MIVKGTSLISWVIGEGKTKKDTERNNKKSSKLEQLLCFFWEHTYSWPITTIPEEELYLQHYKHLFLSYEGLLNKAYPASMNPKPRTATADRARIVLGTLICKKGRFSYGFSLKSLFFDITVTNPPLDFTKTLPKRRTLSLGQRKLLCCTCKVSIFHFPWNQRFSHSLHDDKAQTFTKIRRPDWAKKFIQNRTKPLKIFLLM